MSEFDDDIFRDDVIDCIVTLAQAATPGLWSVRDGKPNATGGFDIIDDQRKSFDNEVAGTSEWGGIWSKDDADFICAVQPIVAMRLCRLIRDLQAEVAELQSLIDDEEEPV